MSTAPPDAAPAEPCVCITGFCEAKYHGWECTRERGHEGDHVACSTTTHRLKTWPQVQR
jgi:hypothetical protein